MTEAASDAGTVTGQGAVRSMGPDPGSGQSTGPARSAAAGQDAYVDRDGAALSRFTEDYAFALVQMGFPRMPARVLVALFITDEGRLTAAELAEALQASPAAVSGAVRYLIHIGLVRREGEPGSRRHFYRVPDDCWEEVLRLRDGLMSRWAALVRDGVGVLGAGTPAGARLAETAEFLEFVSTELPKVMHRWQEHKEALSAAAEG